MMALLQPSPEIFRLFDDVMLLSDGICIYYGPCTKVLPFFEGMGFQCPPRMAIPGFLQNITSSKDQQVRNLGCPCLMTVSSLQFCCGSFMTPFLMVSCLHSLLPEYTATPMIS